MLGEARQEIPRLVMRPAHGVQGPHLRLPRPGPLADARQVGEQQARCFHGVVTSLPRDDQRQLRLDERCELAALPEHAAVGRDEPVPRLGVVVESKQELPVVEVRHSGIDAIDPHQLGVDLELGQDLHDRIREVVVESEQARHTRPDPSSYAAGRRLRASCCSRSRASSIASRSTCGYSR